MCDRHPADIGHVAHHPHEKSRFQGGWRNEISWHAHGMYDFRPMNVACVKWQDSEHEDVLFRICTSNEKIESPIAHAHFEQENKTAYWACALREKLIFCTGSWLPQIVHSMHSLEKYRLPHVREGASDLHLVCNSSRYLVFGSSRLGFGLALFSPRLDWLVLQTINTRLESPSSCTRSTTYYHPQLSFLMWEHL